MKIKSEFKTKSEAMDYLTKRGWNVCCEHGGEVHMTHEKVKNSRLIAKGRSGKWVIRAI